MRRRRETSGPPRASIGRCQREFARSSPIFRLRINAVLPFTRGEQGPWNGITTRDGSVFQHFDGRCLPYLLTYAAICMEHQASLPILKTLTVHGNQRAPDAVFRAFAQMVGKSVSCNYSPLAPRRATGRVPSRQCLPSRKTSPFTDHVKNRLMLRALTVTHTAGHSARPLPNPLTIPPGPNPGRAHR